MTLEYHDCEFEQIEKETYCYYYGSKENHTAWVTIKRTEAGKWWYIRLNNVSNSGEFQNLQECIDAAYEDMVRSKL